MRSHPLALLRPRLARRGLLSAAQLDKVRDGQVVRACGIVTLRQQPETAKGTIFISLEDETGTVQVICWKSIRETQREALLQALLMAVQGVWQREGSVRNLIAQEIRDLTPMLGRLASLGKSRDFR